ncbi:MAG TPA: GNAT family N-acetyltransferase [Anaerolineales bacterium]|nr:GNAT family N-acetyltransferase [Anaerolineales bacterium]
MNPLDWSHPESLYTVVCRPALPKDTPDVMELTSTIWGGEDYVPQVWEDWLEDPHGLLAVAEYGGRVVGLSKLTRLAEGQWWLEGLRVHPQYEGRGIASRLHNYLVDHWLTNFSGALRLATASFRKPVQHLSERSGFKRVADLSSYRAAALAETTIAFTPVRESELEQATLLAQGSPLAALTASLMNADFHWSELSAGSFIAFIIKQRALWWRGQGGLLLLSEEEDDGVLWLMVGAAACELESLPEMLMDYRRLAGSLGHPYAAWMIPPEPALRQPLEAAGFTPNWDFSIYIYEKRHPGKI